MGGGGGERRKRPVRAGDDGALRASAVRDAGSGRVFLLQRPVEPAHAQARLGLGSRLWSLWGLDGAGRDGR